MEFIQEAAPMTILQTLLLYYDRSSHVFALLAVTFARMPYTEKRRLEKERKIKNDAAKCRKMNEFFTVNNASQDERPKSDRSRPTNPSPPENPVQIENNRQEESTATDEDDDPIIELEHRQPEIIPEEKGTLKTTKDYYKGYPLDITTIVRKAGNNVLTLFNEKSTVATKDARKRTFVKCLVCAEFEEEARKCSGNSRV